MAWRFAVRRSYRQMVQELDEILLWFESEDVDLDEAIAKYQQATKIITQMEDYLKTAEIKIRKISSSKAGE